MRRKGARASLAVALALAACGCDAPAPRVGPLAAVERAGPAAAEVRAGDPLRAVFRVDNRGDAALTLRPHAARCGDTAVRLPRGPVPPGGSARVLLEMQTEGLAGPVRRTAAVLTNDPDRPRVDLAVTGTVRARWRAEPRRLFLGRIARGERSRLEIVLHGPRSAGLSVRARSRAPVAPSLEPPALPGEAARLRFTARADAAEGPFRSEFAVTGGERGEPDLVVTVAGVVVPEVVADPPRLVLASAAAGVTFLLVAPAGRPFRVVGLSAAGREWTAEPLLGGRRYRVRIAPGRPLARRGRLRVRVALPEPLEVEVPFSLHGEGA